MAILGIVSWSRRASARVDPFQSLQVQSNLGRLSGEITRLRADSTSFAAAHHLRAALLAYDGLLAEACALAGVTPPAGWDAVGRLLAEAELRVRGWTW